MESEPSKNLLPECLPNINYNIIVFTIARTVIDKQRCITPEKTNSFKSKAKKPKISEETKLKMITLFTKNALKISDLRH